MRRIKKREREPVDWDTIDEAEYYRICRARRHLETDLAEAIEEFEYDTGLEVDDLWFQRPGGPDLLLEDGSIIANEYIHVMAYVSIRLHPFPWQEEDF